jgi:hypothetical protein
VLQNATTLPGKRERNVHATVANPSSPRRRLVSKTLSRQDGLQEESLRQKQVQLIIPIMIATITLTVAFCSQINRRRNSESYSLYFF